MHRLRFLGLLLTALGAPDAFAQQGMPSVTGPVVPVRSARFDMVTQIHVSALSSTNAPLPDAAVRLRDARSGHIVGAAQTDKAGGFDFRPLDPGSYVVELLGADERVLAASELLSLNAHEALSTIVRLPFRLDPHAGAITHRTASALLVTAAAAASGVLATQVTGEPVSPRR